jgi:hypothetical protein
MIRDSGIRAPHYELLHIECHRNDTDSRSDTRHSNDHEGMPCSGKASDGRPTPWQRTVSATVVAVARPARESGPARHRRRRRRRPEGRHPRRSRGALRGRVPHHPLRGDAPPGKRPVKLIRARARTPLTQFDRQGDHSIRTPTHLMHAYCRPQCTPRCSDHANVAAILAYAHFNLLEEARSLLV